MDSQRPPTTMNQPLPLATSDPEETNTEATTESSPGDEEAPNAAESNTQEMQDRSHDHKPENGSTDEATGPNSTSDTSNLNVQLYHPVRQPYGPPHVTHPMEKIHRMAMALLAACPDTDEDSDGSSDDDKDVEDEGQLGNAGSSGPTSGAPLTVDTSGGTTAQSAGSPRESTVDRPRRGLDSPTGTEIQGQQGDEATLSSNDESTMSSTSKRGAGDDGEAEEEDGPSTKKRRH